jgi:hypothetical protein
MKNILAENMRRFGTKNLSEQTANLDPSSLTPAQQMVQWVMEFIDKHGFKLDTSNWGNANEKIYAHRNLRGAIAIELATPNSDGDTDYINIRVERSGTKRATFNNPNEEYLWDQRYLGKEWDATKASQINTVLKPYL